MTELILLRRQNLKLKQREKQMPKYEYKCPECGHEYNEYRDVEHPQWKTICVVDGCEGVFEEVK